MLVEDVINLKLDSSMPGFKVLHAFAASLLCR